MSEAATVMANILVLKTVAGLQRFLSTLDATDQFQPQDDSKEGLGLVPTMGALHPGHLSLIQRACRENRWVIVSLFVNPLQFGPHEDLAHYPRTFEADLDHCQAAGVTAVFAPDAATLLPQDSMTQVIPPAHMTATLCGRSRPGHLQGAATIVLKLLNLIQPDRAYFGQKDAQQLAIIQKLVQDLSIPVEIVPCPIVRAANGLAYSSRNQYLSTAQTQTATVLYRSLQQAQAQFQARTVTRADLLATVQTTLAQEPDVTPDYVELVDPQTFQPLEQITEVGLLAIAAYIGPSRLIDNILLDARPPILAVDGPAGAGKSTVTRLSAQQLGLMYLDTGAMYRAVTWLVLTAQIDLQDQVAIAELLSQCQIQFQLDSDPQQPPRIWVNGQDVTTAIRSPEITSQVSTVAAQQAVREALVRQQQVLGKAGGIAVEGRDIGTHVFPDAGLKIFLTASSQERARRRLQDLQRQGEAEMNLDQLEQAIITRDHKDSQREIAPLRQAADAVVINTDGLRIEEVTAKIVGLYRDRFPQGDQA